MAKERPVKKTTKREVPQDPVKKPGELAHGVQRKNPEKYLPKEESEEQEPDQPEVLDGEDASQEEQGGE